MPTIDDDIRESFEKYCLALGKVAHAWNYLQERLGSLFGTVIGQNDGVAFAIWYSSTSDRAQRAMLKASAESVTTVLSHPKAKDDIVWLVDKANHYSERRNDAIHAPCAIAIGGTEFQIVASYFNGNPRAKNLLGKDILAEFAWSEATAEHLTRFAAELKTAMIASSYPWPNRPLLPSLGQKSTPQDQPPRLPPK